MQTANQMASLQDDVRTDSALRKEFEPLRFHGLEVSVKCHQSPSPASVAFANSDLVLPQMTNTRSRC
jgi:hypothetical protein